MTPRLGKETVDFIERLLTPDSFVLEYGSGFSTLWFAKRVKEIISHENSLAWFNIVNERAKDEGVVNLRLIFDSKYWSLGDWGKTFDVILIDGKKRLQCAMKSIPFLKAGGYVILDNAEFRKNQPAVDFLTSLGWEPKQLGGFKKKAFAIAWRKPK